MGWFQNNAPPQNNLPSPGVRQFLGAKAGPAPMPTQDAGGMGQATDQGNYSWTNWNPTPDDQAEGQRYLDDMRLGRGTDIFGNLRQPQTWNDTPGLPEYTGDPNAPMMPFMDARRGGGTQYPGGSNNFDESRPDDPYWKERYRQNPNAPEWQKQPGYQTSEGPGGWTGQGPITGDQLGRLPTGNGNLLGPNPIQGGNAMTGDTGMVQLRAPTGEVRAVPASQAQRFIGRGATKIG